MYNFGLVLEGGGMRGLYSAGVLDFLIDEGIEFNAVYGVSAGSANGCNFISRQRKRTYHIYTDFIDDKRYASFDNLIRTGNFFGTEMNYDEIPNKLIPYDYDKFLEYKGDFYVVVTNCETGHPMYKKITDLKKELYILRASCSLPLMAEMVNVDGVPCLDGGISDSIPVRRSVKYGHTKNVVVLTRDISYRKKSSRLLSIMKLKYSAYPNLVRAIERRYMVYNRTLDYIENQERKGNLFVIRPSRPVKVGRLEKDKEKLTRLYNRGYQETKKLYPQLMEFLNS